MLHKINRLKNYQGFRKYFANTSWLMAERIFRAVAVLIVGIYVARYLGPKQFGLLSYAISFVGLFMALGTLGLDGMVVRELVKTPELEKELLGTSFGLKIVGTILLDDTNRKSEKKIIKLWKSKYGFSFKKLTKRSRISIKGSFFNIF